MVVACPVLRPRLLLIEDDPVRIETFRAWTADTPFVLIEASSGGRARGLLRRGMMDAVAGVCLDHDLEKQLVTDADARISASHLLDAIRMSLRAGTPILIHSMNATQPPRLERRLRADGFDVTRSPMSTLNRERFLAWLEGVLDYWQWLEAKR